MTRNLIRSATFATLTFLGASMASAQEFANLGELLDKGGKRLDAAELRALLTGATTSGTLLGGRFDVETTYANDGKMSGRFWGGSFPPFFRERGVSMSRGNSASTGWRTSARSVSSSPATRGTASTMSTT
jgi:hypothetical protein